MAKMTEPLMGAGQVQGGYGLEQFFQGEGLTVKQTMKGCFKECLGCEDTSEYRIGDYIGVDIETSGSANFPFKMYALEQSSAFWRCCICNAFGCTSGRALTLNVSQFNPQGKMGEGGAPLVKYDKPCSCPVCVRIPTEDGYIPVPCCCNLPKLDAIDVSSGRKLGSSQYICDMHLCVPKWKVFNSQDQLTYMVRPDTCCMGCCIQCRCGGGKKGGCLYEPMIIRDPSTMAKINATSGEEAWVAKVWSGMKKECCSEADNFCIRYPDGVDVAMRANLLGLCFLVDFTCYEGNDG